VARLTRTETKDRTRRRLVDAAEKLFAKRGYHATTVEEISEAAGFSRGAFYANFTDKADLFIAIIEQRATDAFDVAASVMAETPDDLKLAALGRWFDSFVLDHRLELAWAEFWPSAARDRALRQRLAARQRAMRAAIVRMVDDYCASAGVTLPIATDRFAAMLQAVAEGIRAQAHVDPGTSTTDLFLEAITCLWAGLFTARD
jgi:AcrR family transcriptional regulator